MALENTRSFTTIISGKKVTLPRFADLPYDCLEALAGVEEAHSSPEGITLRVIARHIAVFKDLVPGFSDVTRWASTPQLTKLIADWLRYEEVSAASDSLAKK